MTMNQIIHDEAVRLAARRYTEVVIRETTTLGNPIYIARAIELRFCTAQGQTSSEALAELQTAKLDLIASLLEDGIPIPEPVGFSFNHTVMPRLEIDQQPDVDPKLVLA